MWVSTTLRLIFFRGLQHRFVSYLNDYLKEKNIFTFSVDKQNPAEVEDFTNGARVTSGGKQDGVIKTPL